MVEKWNPHAKVRQDLFGIIDVLAVGKDVIAVQTTSYGNMSARITKIKESEALPVLKSAGWKVLVQGWHKVKNRWMVREVEL